MQLTHEELRILDHIQLCLMLQADFPFRPEDENRQAETLLVTSPCFETDGTLLFFLCRTDFQFFVDRTMTAFPTSVSFFLQQTSSDML